MSAHLNSYPYRKCGNDQGVHVLNVFDFCRSLIEHLFWGNFAFSTASPVLNIFTAEYILARWPNRWQIKKEHNETPVKLNTCDLMPQVFYKHTILHRMRSTPSPVLLSAISYQVVWNAIKVFVLVHLGRWGGGMGGCGAYRLEGWHNRNITIICFLRAIPCCSSGTCPVAVPPAPGHQCIHCHPETRRPDKTRHKIPNI